MQHFIKYHSIPKNIWRERRNELSERKIDLIFNDLQERDRSLFVVSACSTSPFRLCENLSDDTDKRQVSVHDG